MEMSMPKKTAQKGFSLLEVVVAISAFLIVIMGTVQIITQSTRSYKQMKTIQRNLESVQFVLNLISKELRTSSIVASSLGATVSTLTFFDYSQNRCIQYRFDETAGTVQKRFRGFAASDPNANRSSCSTYAASFTESYEILLTGLTNHALYVDTSVPMPTPRVGRVTVSLTAGTDASAQTSVSLRDYNYIGL